jgi:peroxiredoxin
LSAPADPTEPQDPVAAALEPPKVRGLIIGGLIALALIVIGVLSLSLGGNHRSSSGQSTGASTIKVGQQVPRFSLPSLSGEGRVGVPADGGGAGRPAVLVFFASWCGPCQREMPGLVAAIKAGGAGRAQVIGIDGQDTTAAARRFVESTGIAFPVGRDTDYSVTSGKFGFVGLPETVFVDSHGKVTGVHFGATTPELLRQGTAGL